jgi:hypothetical protein
MLWVGRARYCEHLALVLLPVIKSRGSQRNSPWIPVASSWTGDSAGRVCLNNEESELFICIDISTTPQVLVFPGRLCVEVLRCIGGYLLGWEAVYG